MKRYFTVSFFSFINEEENDGINRKIESVEKLIKIYMLVFLNVQFLFIKGSKMSTRFSAFVLQIL